LARLKRKSTVLDTARQRLSGLKSITPAPDFGANLKVEDYEKEINDFSDKIDNYNAQLATLDALQNEIDIAERNLRVKNGRMLSAAEAQYGPDSSQYEQAGGTRTSERKKSSKKTPNKG
jgi:hypothetical protein